MPVEVAAAAGEDEAEVAAAAAWAEEAAEGIALAVAGEVTVLAAALGPRLLREDIAAARR